MSAFILEKLCRGCQRCIHACPQKAIQLQSLIPVVNPELCIECEECMEVCMQGAITFRENSGEVSAHG